MNRDELLATLQWHDFSVYPIQLSDVVLRCTEVSNNERTIKYFKIKQFNAATFDINSILANLDSSCKWKIDWIESKIVEDVLKQI